MSYPQKLFKHIQFICVHKGFRRYLKNTSWLFSGQMIRMIIGLFVSVAVARYLGPRQFGLYNFITSIVALVAVVGNLGLQNLIKRELVDFPEQRNQILGTAFVLTAATGVSSYIGMLFIVGCSSNSYEWLGLFALLGSVLFTNPFKCIETWFQSQVRSDLSVAAVTVVVIISAILKVSVVLKGGTLIEFGYIVLIEGFLVSFMYLYFYKKNFGSVLKWMSNLKTAKDLLRQSWPLIFSGVAVAVYMRIDQIMLGKIVGETAVGEYAVAVRLSAIWHFVPKLLAISLFPAIVNSMKQGRVNYERRLKHYFNLNAGLAYVICAVVSVCSNRIVELLYGSNYGPAGVILAIHVWCGLFVFLGVARSQYLIAEKLFKFSMLCTIFGAVVNIALNSIFISRFGGVGAAVSTLASYSISSYFSSFLLLTKKPSIRFQLLAIFVPIKLVKMSVPK
ncbi:flippase [Puniceicoccus vermicola]|uniref:Flippase n=1 Tax=Puniceicoccus vermicola TaxID=388746 RepID=A0A7X1AWE0_9BACT|nr:flippase [Puniceicoccus vermicola]MBC2601186.1 flippase [Puniceicoccus vermicola]